MSVSFSSQNMDLDNKNTCRSRMYLNPQELQESRISLRILRFLERCKITPEHDYISQEEKNG